MSDLRYIKLGQLARGFRGVSYTPDQLLEHSTESTYTLLRSNNISGGFLNFTKTQIVPAVVVNEEQVLQSGDVAVCMSNGSKALVGKTAAYKDVNGRYTVGAFCSIFRAFNTEDSSFLAHIFQSNSFRKHIDLILAGSAINNLRNRDIEEYELVDFAPNERLKLAEILDTLETQIRKTEAIINKLQQVKKGLLHDLLTRGVDENGELRPNYQDAPELYKPSELGWIPKDWDCLQLEELSEQIVDCPHSTPKFSNEGHLVARTMHIKNGTFLDKEASRVSEDEYKVRISRLEPKAGDIIFTREAPVGEAFVIPEGMKICLGQRVMIIRTKEKVLDSYFLLYQFYSELMNQRFNLLTAGTTTPHLNVSDVKELLILKPSFKEQQLHKDYLEVYSLKQRHELATLNKLKLKKSGLMDDLLTGKKRVSEILNQQQAS
jgi:type I restriction enzyme, S subunit